MSWFSRFVASSIGKKLLVALSGLALLGFLFGHLYGNLHLFWGAEPVNEYAHHLHENWWLPIAELGILGAFLLHIFLVIKLTLDNRAARGQSYAGKKSRQSGFKYVSSKAMLLSGLIVLTFLVVHIADYRLGRAAHDAALAACLGGNVAACDHTVGATLLSTLQVPWRAALYIMGSLFIGWHLFHGIQSAARSLGVNHRKYTPVIETAGAVISITLGVLFAAIPTAVIVTGGNMPFAPAPAAQEASVVEPADETVADAVGTDDVAADEDVVAAAADAEPAAAPDAAGDDVAAVDDADAAGDDLVAAAADELAADDDAEHIEH